MTKIKKILLIIFSIAICASACSLCSVNIYADKATKNSIGSDASDIDGGDVVGKDESQNKKSEYETQTIGEQSVNVYTAQVEETTKPEKSPEETTEKDKKETTTRSHKEEYNRYKNGKKVKTGISNIASALSILFIISFCFMTYFFANKRKKQLGNII